MRFRPIDFIPFRNGSSDVAALFCALFFIAVAMLFFSRVTTYQPLRSQGESIEGRWIDGFVEPRTDQFEAIYRFDLDGKSFRGRQRLAPSDYSGDGQPVTVLYLPENPKISRVLGGEAITAGDALGFSLAMLGVLLSLQHIYAFYRERPSWALILRRLTRLR